MFSSRIQGSDCGPDARKFDPTTGQWMREALESRMVIEELKAQNAKLQREINGLNSKMNLVYESCADLNVVDRLGDLMQRKMHNYQAIQVARNDPALINASAALVHPLNHFAKKKGSDDQGYICGSSTFQDSAAYPSSYKGQTSRGNFHRVRVFEAEEAKLRDQLDIFGVPKLPLQKTVSLYPTERTGDTIDKLLMSAEEANSPMKSARQDTNHSNGCVPVGFDTGMVRSSRI